MFSGLIILLIMGFCNWLWTRNGVIRAAPDVPWNPAACLEGRECDGFLPVNLTLSQIADFGAFPAPRSTAANTRTPEVLSHSSASPSWNFRILMCPDYLKLKMSPLISWSTSGYKHAFGAVWEPNRRDSHPKNSSFSFTLQWTNWKK